MMHLTSIDPADFARARETLDFTAAELAEMLGMSKGEIVAIEAGQFPIERRTALAMAYLMTIHRAADAQTPVARGDAIL